MRIVCAAGSRGSHCGPDRVNESPLPRTTPRRKKKKRMGSENARRNAPQPPDDVARDTRDCHGDDGDGRRPNNVVRGRGGRVRRPIGPVTGRPEPVLPSVGEWRSAQTGRGTVHTRRLRVAFLEVKIHDETTWSGLDYFLRRSSLSRNRFSCINKSK